MFDMVPAGSAPASSAERGEYLILPTSIPAGGPGDGWQLAYAADGELLYPGDRIQFVRAWGGRHRYAVVMTCEETFIRCCLGKTGRGRTMVFLPAGWVTKA